MWLPSINVVCRHDGICSESDFLVFNRVELSLETSVGCPEPDKRARGNERGGKGKTRQAEGSRSEASSQIANKHRALAVVLLAQRTNGGQRTRENKDEGERVLNKMD